MFLPILLMTGLVGRLFREFAVVLSVAIALSLLISLTTTPMMCARMLRDPARIRKHGRIYRLNEWIFNFFHDIYRRTLAVALNHPLIMICMTFLTCFLTVTLYHGLPQGLFPQQDTGRMMGMITADQDTSFQAMSRLLNQYAKVVGSDPDVSGVMAFAGGSSVNTARMFVSLKPLGQRKITADQVIARIRRPASKIPGGILVLQPVQDLRVGGRLSAAQYQYTLQSDNLEDLLEWAPNLLSKLQSIPQLSDVNTDQQDRGLESMIQIDRATASRMGITPQLIDDTLYDAFGQRDVSTMYTAINQYFVVLEVAPKYWQGPDGLKHIYVRTSNNMLTPLNTFAKYVPTTTFLTVNHQGLFPCVTISFNLPAGISLSDADTIVQNAEDAIHFPATIHGSFQGTAQAFESSKANEPILIAAALLAVYIVLGMLYESYIHPITILSTLPSAGVGAFVAMKLAGLELDMMGLIGILLLIGIVKKNGIMMVDYALETERSKHVSPRDAIFAACLVRFRPIMMTTMAAILARSPWP